MRARPPDLVVLRLPKSAHGEQELGQGGSQSNLRQVLHPRRLVAARSGTALDSINAVDSLH
jgi:hypothetical protein